MGIRDLQACLENSTAEGICVPVDLLKIAKSVSQRQQPHNANRKIRPPAGKLKLIVDAENCLDRLYGGYFSDWACGGQWNRMIQFLSLLHRAVDRGNIELAVVFNGTIESCRMKEWLTEQTWVRQKVASVLKHINTKGTPPPKVWWTAPIGTRSSLRMALRHLNVSVMCTMDDHHQEVIAYCRESGFHGLLADDAEYAAFDPPRYFSSENLKLTYKGSLETKEYMVGELTKMLEISQEQLCVLASLLGNFLLPEIQLQDLYRKLGITKAPKDNKPPAENNLKKLAEFVRTLPSHSNMDALVAAVFGSPSDKRAAKFRQSVQYYLNGTASGFLKYCTPPSNPTKEKKQAEQQKNNSTDSKEAESDLKISGAALASETVEQEEETLQNYKLATVNLVMDSEDFTLDAGADKDSLEYNGYINGATPKTSAQVQNNNNNAPGTSKANLQVSPNSSNTSSLPSSPKHGVEGQSGTAAPCNPVTPAVSPDVLRTASLRHQKGLMASMILHVLSTQEVRLPCLMEDENNREIPPIHEVYLLLRQRVYAVLFNLHHLRYVHNTKKKEGNDLPENSQQQPDILIKEWVYSRTNPYNSPEIVKAEPLPWAVPTLQRLWFGPSVDDKRRRMRALLSCMNADTPLVLNTGYVPQHMLIMACVLRYIMSYEKPIMRRNELDAFLCQAFNPDLMNPQYLQELTLSVVTSRGVQLASLFMEGVEMALLANDACGAPVPWLMCCPWLYFDGKLFHQTLNRSAHAKNILEVCENHIDRVVKVERMRKAILEGLDYKFAKPPLQNFQGMLRQQLPPSTGFPTMPMGGPPNRMPPNSAQVIGMRGRPIPSRGGQLQVAGVVVGSWGANYGYQQQQHNMRPGPQHNMLNYQPQQQGRPRSYAGPPGPPIQQYGGGNFNNHYGNNQQRGAGGYGRGRGPPQHQQQQHHTQQRGGGGKPTYHTHKKANSANKKRANKPNAKKEQANDVVRTHTLTVKTEDGDIPADELFKKTDGKIHVSIKEKEHSLEEKEEDDTTVTPKNAAEHKGQGDAPEAAASAAAVSVKVEESTSD